MALLEVNQLAVHFTLPRRRWREPRPILRAVDGVSLVVAPGETVGLVGESGCGKSTVARAIVRLLEPTAGSIRLEGEDLVPLRGPALREKRRHLQMVFQDPHGSLDPRTTAGQSIGEALEIHRLCPDKPARARRIIELLEAVGLTPEHADRYPHEFSGGQRQRIGIARALAVDPRIIICDEPVSALDISIQAQIVNLLADLQEAKGLAYLFIAHDLAVVEHLSDRILVMYLGRIVEEGPAREIVGSPRHPYTQALISAVPVIDPATQRARIQLAGEVPSPIDPPSGCPFHPRCPIAQPQCREVVPALREIVPGHRAACHLA